MGQETYYKPAKVMILTGAGFTKNFGGLLASEMWSLILNQKEIASCEKVRQHLLQEINYEQVYDTVINSEDFTPGEKQAITLAIEKAYGELDAAIRPDPGPFVDERVNSLSSFISRFKVSGQERTFFFTLNQDLLVERLYNNRNEFVQIPGLGHPDWFTSRFSSPLSSNHEIRLLDQAQVEKWNAKFWARSSGIQNFVYIKLHGSYGWHSQKKSSAIVIGTTKTRIIEKEPLLRWYFELLKNVLNRPGQTLVIIGYGFMDEHINNVIADAIRDAGLKLHVILPKEPKSLRDVLDPIHASGYQPAPRGSELWSGLYGYTCAKVQDLVRPSSDLTPQGEAFFRQIGLS